jgi:hypothetical protein
MNSVASESPVGMAGVEPRPASRSLSRRDFFTGLAILGCVNGLASKVIPEINRTGWTDAALSTTNISIIVWASCLSGLLLMARAPSRPARGLDFRIAGALGVLLVLPIGELNWAALSALCLYVIWSSDSVSLRQGAIILLAATVPMLWSPMLFKMFANPILSADASLVSWLLGTARTGNVVEFMDGSGGTLVIFPACSSLANVSLAMLCWITVSRLVNHEKSFFDWLWCAAACASVVAVNVSRMALMGLGEQAYESVHSPTGNVIASAIMLTLTISICLWGVRRELFARV